MALVNNKVDLALSGGFLPEFLPDETLFSWCSRYHRMAVNGLSRTTCIQLFGHPRLGSAHDFPCRLNTFVDRTDHMFGNALEIIQHRTILPFYLPFKSQELANEAIASLKLNGVGNLKFQLGLLTSGFGAAHPLKSCPECVRADREQYGWSYWHRSHQLPGVWFCPEHHRPLQVTRLKLDQVARFSWLVPSNAYNKDLVVLSRTSEASKKMGWAARLQSAGIELLKYPACTFDDVHKISRTLRRRLVEKGFAKKNGRICWLELRPCLSNLLLEMSDTPEFHTQTDLLLESQLTRLLTGRALTHPLRYLIWIALWFENLADFHSAYSSTAEAESEARQVPSSGVSDEELQTRLRALDAVRRGELSLTAAGGILKVSYATVAAWAAKENILPSRRPKSLDVQRWCAIRDSLLAGEDKVDIATRNQVSIVTVTRILRSVPGLQSRWHRIRLDQRRKTHRQAWEETLQLHAQLGIKAMRKMVPATYSWLYRNDRDWLNASLSRAAAQPAENNAAVRMIRADTHMATVLQSVRTTYSERNEPDILQAVKREIPAISNVLRYPARWPLTIKALESWLNHKDTEY